MKTYILVHHATGKEIEVKADIIIVYPEVYDFKNEKDLIVGRFSVDQFSWYVKIQKDPRSSDYKVTGNNLSGILDKYQEGQEKSVV